MQSVKRQRGLGSVLALLLAATLLAPTILWAQEPPQRGCSVLSNDIAELVSAGDAEASAEIASGLANIDATDAYTQGLSDEERLYVSLDCRVVDEGGVSYSVTIHASPQWLSDDELAAQPMTLGDQSFEDAMLGAWEELAQRVDIASWNITRKDFEARYMGAVIDAPEEFQVRSWYKIPVVEDSEIITQVGPIYLTDSQEEYANMRTAYESAVSRALDSIPCNVSALAKIYWLHDWVCDLATYNYAASRVSTYEDSGQYASAWSSYGVMVDGSAVCQGYSLALSDLLERAGFENTTLFVFSMNHAWNMVLFGGNWYHIDSTWDDTKSGNGSLQQGNIGHAYFMKSDTGIGGDTTHTAWNSGSGRYYGWESSMVASDGVYDDYDWAAWYAGSALGTGGAHSWDAGSVVLKATTAHAGTTRYACTLCGATKDEPLPKVQTVRVYRLLNPRSNEHLWTTDANEAKVLSRQHGWKIEEDGWYAPQSSQKPVYRLHNRRSGEHHFTTDENEAKTLVSYKIGWINEGVKFYSDEDEKALPVYRVWSRTAVIGCHHYTASANEYAILVNKRNWKDEGVAWYGSAAL